MKAIAFIDSRK